MVPNTLRHRSITPAIRHRHVRPSSALRDRGSFQPGYDPSAYRFWSWLLAAHGRDSPSTLCILHRIIAIVAPSSWYFSLGHDLLPMPPYATLCYFVSELTNDGTIRFLMLMFNA